MVRPTSGQGARGGAEGIPLCLDRTDTNTPHPKARSPGGVGSRVLAPDRWETVRGRHPKRPTALAPRLKSRGTRRGWSGGSQPSAVRRRARDARARPLTEPARPQVSPSPFFFVRKRHVPLYLCCPREREQVFGRGESQRGQRPPSWLAPRRGACVKGPKTASSEVWGITQPYCGRMDLSPIRVHTESQASLENRGPFRACASGEGGGGGLGARQAA